MSIDRDALVQGLITAAVEAAGVIMSHYENDVEVMRKGDKSPVTIADREAEAILLRHLKTLAPEIPVVAEEEVAAGRIPKTLGECFFLVDPLDGTKEFLKQNGQFTVNIGLIENGAPTLGVVYAPALGRMYFGIGPGRAFVQEIDPQKGVAHIDDHPATAIAARVAPEDGVVAVSSGSHKHEAVEAFLKDYDVIGRTEMGSSLKFCLIAAGEADIYPRQPESSCEWDVAAAHAVLRAAGGEVTCIDGTPFDYGHAERKFLNPGFVARGRRA